MGVGAVAAQTGREFTWRELNERANRFANALLEIGLSNGDRVAILCDNRFEYFEVFYGAAKVGAVVVNINHRLSSAEIQAIVRETQPRVFVTTSALLSGLADHTALDSWGVEVILTLGEEADEDGGTLNEFSLSGDNGDPSPRQPIQPLDPLTVQFSSGATGVPKGVIWSHRGAMANSLNFGFNYGLMPGTRLMLSTPISAHCGMLVSGGFLGCRLIFTNFDAETVLETVERTRTEWLSLVPILVQRLSEAQAADPRDLSSLSNVIYGGSPIAVGTLRMGLELLKCRFWQIYSLSEACLAGCVLRPEDHLDLTSDKGLRRLTSCGRPYLNVGVRLLGSGGDDVPLGEPGEIWIYSEGSMIGYWGAPDLSASTLVDGWVRTGDIGRQDEDGYLYIVDRVKDMIISGAFNMYPAEIERVLADHDAVSEVAVIGVPDDVWGERVHACVVLREGASTTESELSAFCRRRLGGAKTPRSFDFRSSLPRNALGKVVKRDLRAPFWAGRERSV
jgi:long-chain acyl-CoA synthetase